MSDTHALQDLQGSTASPSCTGTQRETDSRLNVSCFVILSMSSS